MTTGNYNRSDSTFFAKKVSKKIDGWYSNNTYHNNAVERIVRQREEIYSLFDKVEKVNTKKLLKYLDSSGFFYRPSSANRHHNYPGGLAEHSLGTFHIVEEWNKMTPEERKGCELYRIFLFNKQVTCDIFHDKMSYDDMLIACICHDLCKAKHYYINGRVIKIHNSDPEPRYKHGLLSIERLAEKGITDDNCQELRLAVLLHMRLFSKARNMKEEANQKLGKASMLAIAVWAADKLDASRHPAGNMHEHY